MTQSNYERLSALDNLFLVFESATTPMHVGSAAVFDTGPLTRPGGGIDAAAIKQYIAARLDRIPRYRERLAHIPVEDRAVWVDDAGFDLEYHVRHTSVPKPGTDALLKQVCARIFAQPLDLTRPLWETWIVEGLEGGRFALVMKVHHCMIDGVSGADLMTVLLSTTPEIAEEAPARWIPRPMPTRTELLRNELVDRARVPLSLAARALRHPLEAVANVSDALGAVAGSLSPVMQTASALPFNAAISSHRRFDWTTMDIDAVKAVRSVGGSTLNDVVLATVAGAVRRFLQRHGVNVAPLIFRVFVPVSTRTLEQRGTLGNQVAGWIVELPIAEPEALRRLEQIHNTTAMLKAANVVRGAEVLNSVVEWTGSAWVSMAMRLSSQTLPFNLVVTNVPGPPMPLYLLGSRLTAVYPMVPLFTNLGLGVALFSNAGRLFWGCNADWALLPDLGDFIADLNGAFAELQEGAGRSLRPRRAAHPSKPPARSRHTAAAHGGVARARSRRHAG